LWKFCLLNVRSSVKIASWSTVTHCVSVNSKDSKLMCRVSLCLLIHVCTDVQFYLHKWSCDNAYIYTFWWFRMTGVHGNGKSLFIMLDTV
jgi:hypothetical protein